jgi:AraC-like DNA-binding protein
MGSTVLVEQLSHATSSWEIARCELPDPLRPYVRSWVGYTERATSICRRRELPGLSVVVIFEFGPPLRVSDGGSDVCLVRGPGGFVAGLDEGPSITEHDGMQAGVQVDLSPLGARACFRLPLRELSKQVVALPDVLPSARGLSERLADVGTWAGRFAMVERLLCERITAAPAASRQVAWALDRITMSGGRVRVDELTRELGHSRKHLGALFHEHVGLTPKRYAQLVRFNRLVARAGCELEPNWSQLAVELGYADQAHLAREVRRFAGVPPTSLCQLLAEPAVDEGHRDGVR